jgi:hypothetical protein
MTYDPQGKHANDVHEDVATLAQDNGVQRHEWLRRAKAHECLSVRL